MIAIPTNDHKRPAGHFSKAPHILIHNPDTASSYYLENPAATEGCLGKKKLIELLQREKVNTVCVRNIGQRMLGRLLDNGLQVNKIQPGQQDIQLISEQARNSPQQLTSPMQGHPSVNHLRKQQHGHCSGCDQDGSSHHKGCCQKKAPLLQTKGVTKGCCGSKK